MPLIETRSLHKAFEEEGTKTVVLHDINISIEKGEFAAIMGPSGSGKSTLLHILGFLDRYTSGKYWFDGKEMSDFTDDELAIIRNQKMGFIFQSFNLLGRTSVLENIKLPLLYSPIPENKWDTIAKDAAEAVGLSHRMNHISSQLSGGERQRVAIARALVTNPDVIFADEPTGNLDSKSGQIVMEIIQDLHDKQGHTVVLITHETYTAEFAERILRVKDGNIENDHKVRNRHMASESFVK